MSVFMVIGALTQQPPLTNILLRNRRGGGWVDYLTPLLLFSAVDLSVHEAITGKQCQNVTRFFHRLSAQPRRHGQESSSESLPRNHSSVCRGLFWH